jgi:hypothetical protein
VMVPWTPPHGASLPSPLEAWEVRDIFGGRASPIRPAIRKESCRATSPCPASTSDLVPGPDPGGRLRLHGPGPGRGRGALGELPPGGASGPALGGHGPTDRGAQHLRARPGTPVRPDARGASPEPSRAGRIGRGDRLGPGPDPDQRPRHPRRLADRRHPEQRPGTPGQAGPARSQERPGPAPGRPLGTGLLGLGRFRGARHRRLGPGRRPAVRPLGDRHRRDRQRQGPARATRSDVGQARAWLHPDGRQDQPRQLGRPAGQPRGRGGGRQHADPGRGRRRLRIRHPRQRGSARGAGAGQRGARSSPRQRRVARPEKPACGRAT